MQKKNAPTIVSTSSQGGISPDPVNAEDVALHRQLFISSALSMSWQMAVVVLVPVISGVKLDQHFKTGSLLTIVGLIVAVVGMFIVVYKAFKTANDTLKSKCFEKH